MENLGTIFSTFEMWEVYHVFNMRLFGKKKDLSVLILAVVISLEMHLKLLLTFCFFTFAWWTKDSHGMSLWID